MLVLSLLPFSKELKCPKCGNKLPTVRWCPGHNIPEMGLNIVGIANKEKPGYCQVDDFEHLHCSCNCGFQMAMKTADHDKAEA